MSLDPLGSPLTSNPRSTLTNPKYFTPLRTAQMFARFTRRPSKIERSPSDSKRNPSAPPKPKKSRKIQKTNALKTASDPAATPLVQHYMETTRLNRYYQQFEAAFRTSSQLQSAATSRGAHVNRIIVRLASRSTHPEAQHVLSRLYEIAGGMRNNKYMGVAYMLMLKFETADGIYR